MWCLRMWCLIKEKEYSLPYPTIRFDLIWGHKTIVIKHHILKHHIPELPNDDQTGDQRFVRISALEPLPSKPKPEPKSEFYAIPPP